MSSAAGSGNKAMSSEIPKIKHVYVRRRRKTQVLKEAENVGDNENKHQNESQPPGTSIGDGSMLVDAATAHVASSSTCTNQRPKRVTQLPKRLQDFQIIGDMLVDVDASHAASSTAYTNLRPKRVKQLPKHLQDHHM